MAYTVYIKQSAQKELADLPRRDQHRQATAISSLAANPRPEGVRKLSGSDDVYRIRVGDYRIIYQIADRVLTVLVIRIGHRKDIYRRW